VTRLYDRRCNLFIATPDGEALDLGQLHCKFAISRSDAQSPNWAAITVDNLADETAKRIQAEGTRLILQAGYRDLVGVIFDGTITQAIYGRPNGTETTLTLAASDGDLAYNFATVNQTLAAGATQADQVKTAIAAMSAHGVGEGFLADMGGPSLPRGKVMYGMARDVMRQSCRSSVATWSIQDGKVQVLKRTGLLPGTAVLLSPSTGLIGTAEQTEDGIKARCLLNPMIRVGGTVKLDQSAILEQVTQAPSGGSTAETKKPSPIAADGIYRVYEVGYVGEIPGNDWYCNLVCLGADQSAPAGAEVSEQ
jgi:hypothetical protein